MGQRMVVMLQLYGSWRNRADAWFAAYASYKISPNHVEPLMETMFLDEINSKLGCSNA
jgi:hypothetical protein